MSPSDQVYFSVRIVLVLSSAICLRLRFCWSCALLHVIQTLMADRIHPFNSSDDRSEEMKHIIGGKIFNILVCWSIVMATDFQHTTWLGILLVVSPCVCNVFLDLTTIRECTQRSIINHSNRRTSLVRTLLYLLGTTSLYIGQCQGSTLYSYSVVTGMVCLWLVLCSDWFTPGRKQIWKPTTRDQEVNPNTDPSNSTSIASWMKELVANPSKDSRVDRVYTVGCFDLFHHGHVMLMQRMRAMGKQVIVGVHTDRSIEVLKKRTPVDDLEIRMMNVKKYADCVFCVAGTDPSAYLRAVFKREGGESALYVRGDDMKNFPGREVCESLMPIKFFPYTEGVSSTLLRQEMGR